MPNRPPVLYFYNSLHWCSSWLCTPSDSWTPAGPMLRTCKRSVWLAALPLIVGSGFGVSSDTPDTDEFTSDSTSIAFPDSDLMDFSHPFNDESIYWPAATEEFVGEANGYFCSLYVFTGAEEIPVEQPTGPAMVIDMREQIAGDRLYQVQVCRLRGAGGAARSGVAVA